MPISCPWYLPLPGVSSKWRRRRDRENIFFEKKERGGKAVSVLGGNHAKMFFFLELPDQLFKLECYCTVLKHTSTAMD